MHILLLTCIYKGQTHHITSKHSSFLYLFLVVVFLLRFFFSKNICTEKWVNEKLSKVENIFGEPYVQQQHITGFYYDTFYYIYVLLLLCVCISVCIVYFEFFTKKSSVLLLRYTLHSHFTFHLFRIAILKCYHYFNYFYSYKWANELLYKHTQSKNKKIYKIMCMNWKRKRQKFNYLMK